MKMFDKTVKLNIGGFAPGQTWTVTNSWGNITLAMITSVTPKYVYMKTIKDPFSIGGGGSMIARSRGEMIQLWKRVE